MLIVAEKKIIEHLIEDPELYYYVKEYDSYIDIFFKHNKWVIWFLRNVQLFPELV